MADNINLLPDQTVSETPVSKSNALVKQASLVILAITIVLTAAVFGADFYFGQKIDGLHKDISAAGDEVNQHKEAEGVYRSAAARLQGSQAFLSSQNHYSRLLEAVRRSLPGGVRLTDFAVADTGSVTISAVAASYLDITAFNSKLQTVGDASVSPYFLNTALTVIDRSEGTPGITFGVTFDVDRRLITGEEH